MITGTDQRERAQRKLVQYLDEAHASELGLTRVLQSQIAMTPAGSYRTALERHLRETRSHADRVQRRLAELDGGRGVVGTGVALAEGAVAQVLALSKTPFDLLRGTGGEEKILKNAKDACATEALEIATYTAIEHLARQVGDDATAQLAASIRADEEAMLERVRGELGALTAAVVGAEVQGEPSYDVSRTGAAQTAKKAARSTRSAARKTTRQTATKARSMPGAARAEGTARGAVASADDLPIARYDALTATEITGKLADLSQVQLSQVATYERKKENRATVLSRIDGLRGDEPWTGYDELNVDEIRAALADADGERTAKVREYERAHKNRAGVLAAAEREIAATA
jgi:ferritin-like metal-binding protein YciE